MPTARGVRVVAGLGLLGERDGRAQVPSGAGRGGGPAGARLDGHRHGRVGDLGALPAGEVEGRAELRRGARDDAAAGRAAAALRGDPGEPGRPAAGGGGAPAPQQAGACPAGRFENAFKGPLVDMDLHHPPCRGYRANQAFHAYGRMAHMLLRAVQYRLLPKTARRHGIRPLVRHVMRTVARLVTSGSPAQPAVRVVLRPARLAVLRQPPARRRLDAAHPPDRPRGRSARRRGGFARRSPSGRTPRNCTSEQYPPPCALRFRRPPLASTSRRPRRGPRRSPASLNRGSGLSVLTQWAPIIRLIVQSICLTDGLSTACGDQR